VARKSLNPLDLIRSKDGSISLTKLAASTDHAFVKQQWNGPFNETQWLIYLGVTVMHAMGDKGMAIMKDLKTPKA
jgi:hypothetical protein